MRISQCLLIGLSSLLLPALVAASARVPAATTLAGTGAPASQPLGSTSNTEDQACGLHPAAARLAELIRQHPLQERLQLNCDGLLAQIAAAKAAEMAERQQVSHILGVIAPNRRLRQAGYALPASYPGAFHNQVEAVAGGFRTAEEALQALLDSPPHRAHVLAEHPFYAAQNEIGVGFARNRDSDNVDFWVVYIARRADGAPAPQLRASRDTSESQDSH